MTDDELQQKLKDIEEFLDRLDTRTLPLTDFGLTNQVNQLEQRLEAVERKLERKLMWFPDYIRAADGSWVWRLRPHWQPVPPNQPHPKQRDPLREAPPSSQERAEEEARVSSREGGIMPTKHAEDCACPKCKPGEWA